jgi:hypothetical protein
MKKFLLSFTVTIIIFSFIPLQKCFSQNSLPIEGKGMYLWQIWTTSGGGKNLDGIINKLKNIGATWLVIKMANANSNYNTPNHSLYNWAVANYGSMDSVTAIFHANGIKLLVYQYVYGVPYYYSSFPESETDVANSILDIKGIDGLVIDAEIEYDNLTNNDAAARAYCDSIKAHHPDKFIVLTAWARIDGHNTFPWATFLERVDVNMPQTYWAARPTTPQNELNIMNDQYTYYTNIWMFNGELTEVKPIMPLGQGVYFGYSNDVMPGDITSFSNLSQSTYNYPGLSLWEFNQITHQYVWDEYSAAWQPTSISENLNVISEYNLAQNYPNPFNPVTSIKYSVPKASHVSLKVYDLLGREVATLVDEEKISGSYQVSFNAANLSSGVYFYRLQSNSFDETRKLILLK